MTEPTVDLGVPALGTLHERRSEKWALYDADVLSLTVAEMDFAIAEPIRDAVIEHFAGLERSLVRAVELAVRQGHLRSDLDCGQFVFEMMGVILAYYHNARLFEPHRAEVRARAAFDRLVSVAIAAT